MAGKMHGSDTPAFRPPSYDPSRIIGERFLGRASLQSVSFRLLQPILLSIHCIPGFSFGIGYRRHGREGVWPNANLAWRLPRARKTSTGKMALEGHCRWKKIENQHEAISEAIQKEDQSLNLSQKKKKKRERLMTGSPCVRIDMMHGT